MPAFIAVIVASLPALLLAGLVFCIAFLYASVGFGGASGYLAIMSFADIPAAISASTALILNVIVAGAAFYVYYRGGHLQPRLLWPFVLTSIPAAFIGGSFKLNQLTYQVLLNTVLLYVGFRLLFTNHQEASGRPYHIPSWPLALFAGAVLGLLSGMVGVGGGIFLSPLILLSGWGEAKQAAASSAGFILLNSLSGLAGRVWSGTLEIGPMGVLILLGIFGGLSGSYLGARYFSIQTVRRLLAVVLLITVARFLVGMLA